MYWLLQLRKLLSSFFSFVFFFLIFSPKYSKYFRFCDILRKIFDSYAVISSISAKFGYLVSYCFSLMADGIDCCETNS